MGAPITTTFTLDRGNNGAPLVVNDGSSDTLILYGLFGMGEYQSEWHYYLGDAQFSVRQLANTSAEVTLARSYDPFGGLLHQAGEGDALFGFMGAQAGGGGLLYINGRYFDPTTSRFLSPDNRHFDPRRPGTLHGYLAALFLANPGGLLFGPLLIVNWRRRKGSKGHYVVLLLVGVGLGIMLVGCDTGPAPAPPPPQPPVQPPGPITPPPTPPIATPTPGAPVDGSPTPAPPATGQPPATPTPTPCPTPTHAGGDPLDETINQLSNHTVNVLRFTGDVNRLREDMKLVIVASVAGGVTTVDQLTYIFATVFHETTWGANMSEINPLPSYEGNQFLCNWKSGDGLRYKGRGFVQITGRCNYHYYSDLFGVDLINNPDLAATDRNLAAEILVHGMVNGVYRSLNPQWSGQAMNSEIVRVTAGGPFNLAAYERGNDYDWVGARHIIHGGGFRAQEIAATAQGYSQIMRSRCPEGLPAAFRCKG